ncbi:hypothetical protein K1516_11040 [Stenotrophomonas maltophilia]|nr:hypothetical protein K1516_11040 [Stenotrophomonas maltophilia]
MSDVGRIQDDHLLCSALWGRIVRATPSSACSSSQSAPQALLRT